MKTKLLLLALALSSCGLPPGSLDNALRQCGPDCFSRPTSFDRQVQENDRRYILNELDKARLKGR
jgi:hypothetical protein